MYRITLTQEQRTDLQQCAHQRDVAPNVRERLEMVRLSDRGWSIPKIACHLQQHEQTVRRWIKAYLYAGRAGLADKGHGGKASAFTPALRQAMEAEICQAQRTWTAKQLAEWLAQEHQVHLSADRIRFHLKRAKFSYKRTSRSLRHKQKAEEVAQKQITFATLKKGAMPD